MRFRLLFPLLLVCGCLASPSGESRLFIHLSFSPVDGNQPGTFRSLSAWHLSATLSGADLETPVEASMKGRTETEASLSLVTLAGGPRQLVLRLFLLTSETLELWTSVHSELYMVPGDQTIHAELVRSPTWDIHGNVACGEDKATLAVLRDISSGLDIPSVPVLEEGENTGIFRFEQIPVGRFLELRFRLESGNFAPVTDCLVFSSRTGDHLLEADLETGTCLLRRR